MPSHEGRRRGVIVLKRRNIILSILISCGLLLLIWSKLNPGQLMAHVRHMDWMYIAAALAASFVSAPLLSSFVWQRLLVSSRIEISLKDSIKVNAAISVFKVLMPFYLGEFSRVVYLERHYGLSRKASLSISFIYLALGFLSRFFWFAGAWLFLGAAHLKGILWAMVTFPTGVRRWLEQYGISWRCLIKPLGLSLLSFAAQIAAFYIVSRSLHLTIPVHAIILFYPLIDILAKISFFFKGFGAREGMIMILFGSYGAPELLFLSGFISSFLIEFISPALGVLFVPSFLHLASRENNNIYGK
jgi:uncharacterized membrane protein YbhN (UPF0104 family)